VLPTFTYLITKIQFFLKYQKLPLWKLKKKNRFLNKNLFFIFSAFLSNNQSWQHCERIVNMVQALVPNQKT